MGVERAACHAGTLGKSGHGHAIQTSGRTDLGGQGISQRAASANGTAVARTWHMGGCGGKSKSRRHATSIFRVANFTVREVLHKV